MMQYEAETKIGITKDNAIEVLKAFANEIRKANRHHPPMEVIVVGGGSIVLNYDFRDSTQDFDVLVRARSDIKEAVIKVAEKYNLPDMWMNTDFATTASYSDKLRDVSEHRATFNNGRLEIRTVKDEYLIAMKMVSAREYRHDISDIAGIIEYSKRNEDELSFDLIKSAVEYLYGDKVQIKKEVWSIVEDFTKLDADSLLNVYSSIRAEEKQVGEKTKEIDRKYPGLITEDSIEDVIKGIKNHKKSEADDTNKSEDEEIYNRSKGR